MKIEILDRAEQDLVEGFHFYEAQQVGLGSYFLVNLYADNRIVGPLRWTASKSLQELPSTLVTALSFRCFLQSPWRCSFHSRSYGLPAQSRLDSETIGMTPQAKRSSLLYLLV